MLLGLPPLARASLSLLMAFAGPAAAWAADAPAAALGRADESFYQQGLTRYARGDLKGALAAFREALRRDPENRFARAAVRRVEGELKRPRSRAAPVPGREPPLRGRSPAPEARPPRPVGGEELR